MRPLTEFYIYEDLDLVCNRVFNKGRITIGSNHDADLYLAHPSVEQSHAVVHYLDNQVFLTNNYPQNGLLLNGRAVGLAELQQEDVIDIGPFSLKIKMTAAQSTGKSRQDANHAVRLVNRYSTARSRLTAARHLAQMLRTDVKRVLPLISKDHHILKKGLTRFKAAKIQNALLKAGVVCDVQANLSKPPVHQDPGPEAMQMAQPAAPRPPQPVAPQVHRPGGKSVSKPKPAAAEVSPEHATAKPVDSGVIKNSSHTAIAADVDGIGHPPAPEVSFTEIFEDDVDGDEEVWQARFSLKTDLGKATSKNKNVRHLPEKTQLQIVKTIGESVVDVRFLEGGQKYTIDTEQGPLHLVETQSKGDGYVNILPTLSGYIQTPCGETKADLASYKTPDCLKIEKKTRQRIPLPETDVVVIEADGCSYRIAWVMVHGSPEIGIAERPSEFSWRHWATSAGVHLFLVLLLSIWAYFQSAPPQPPEPHFVRIDPSMLKKPEPPPKPRIQPKPIEPPQPEPVKVVEKVKKPSKKKTPKKKKIQTKIAQKRPPKKKSAPTEPLRRKPKSGGGSGKGTIKNRNIHQTGILSALGNSSIAGPSQAIAAVANLDAVTVPDTKEKNFSVGGLKGSLGNGKITIAKGGAIMQTKGSKQVLRSAGIHGKGGVAALEQGTTGQKKVQAMVTAKLSRAVKIEGGMSREMVKRVIDRHLEEITFCYETALMSNPNILGRMVFEWKIKMNGRVGEIRIVASSVNSYEIHNCIKAAIKSWQFPKPVGSEVVVSYPFVFDLVSF
jgi:outer membrane biosynthesis protein TonB